MTFTLRDVPAAMRHEGWVVGARLMDRWFEAPLYAMDLRVKTGDLPPHATFTETRIVTMTWALGFARAITALMQLQTDWAKPPRLTRSTPVITRRIQRWVATNNVLPSKMFRFGNFSTDVLTVDQTSAINFQPIDSNWYGPFDDFYAAIGRASMKVAVSGMVEANGDNWRLAIDEIGFYLRDTYDFIGDQRLGSWGAEGFSSAAIAAPEIEIDPAAKPGSWSGGAQYWRVDNTAFRRWRARFRHGGDFVILSDIRRFRLANPVVVTVPR